MGAQVHVLFRIDRESHVSRVAEATSCGNVELAAAYAVALATWKTVDGGWTNTTLVVVTRHMVSSARLPG